MARNRLLRPLLLLAIFCVFTLGVPSAHSQSLDPQSLIGERNGKWARAHRYYGRESSNFYGLTIERVEGNRVYGSGEYAGKSMQSFKFEGVLEGNHLRFGKNVVTDLEITNDQMQGSNTNGSKLSLTKKK